MKKCSKCLLVKNFDDFFRNNKTNDGLQYWCKVCSTQYIRKAPKDNKKAWQKQKLSYVENTELRKRVLAGKIEWRKSKGPLYRTYATIRDRCYCKSHRSFRWYGGRGIKCLWKSFEEFNNDMLGSYLKHLEIHGKKQTSIDRIDVNGHYCKENCRWATWKEQAQNKQKSTK